MEIYNYNSQTLEFISIGIADKSPLEKDVYHIPACATTIKPPIINDQNKTAIFENGKWIIESDFRGQKQINILTKEISIISYIGPIKEGFQQISDELALNIKQNPEKYSLVNGLWEDISTTDKFIAEKLQSLRSEKLAYNEKLANSKLDILEIDYEKSGQILIFKCNKDTQSDLTSAAIGLLAGVIDVKNWTTTNAITVDLTRDDVVSILKSIDELLNPLWAKWGQYVNAINAAVSLQELETIEIVY